MNQSGVSSRAHMHILKPVVAQMPSESPFICAAITWFAVAVKLLTFLTQKVKRGSANEFGCWERDLDHISSAAFCGPAPACGR